MTWIFKGIGLFIFLVVLAGMGQLHGFVAFLVIVGIAAILFTLVTSFSPLAIHTLEQPKPDFPASKPDFGGWVNYYELLGLGPTSSVERIKNRCLELGQSCRPSIHKNDPINIRQFNQIEMALATLSDPASREAYDRAFQEKEKRIHTLHKFDRLVYKHAEELLRKRRQLLNEKGYGVVDQAKWIAEKDYFFEEIVRPVLGDSADMVNGSSRLRIEERLNLHRQSSVQKIPSMPPKNGIEFENQCANLLEQEGWNVLTTKASGDQGADIVAKKRGISAVLQCKLYAKPVGNSAVQEAFAAKAHYGTKYAGVVSKSTYTKSAIALAASTEVLLLHFDDLPNLLQKLKSITTDSISQ